MRRTQVRAALLHIWCALFWEVFRQCENGFLLRQLQRRFLFDLQVTASETGGDAMTKAEIVKEVSRRTRRGRTETAKLVEEILCSISMALSEGSDVKLRGFGTFSVVEKGLSVGKNPRTGEDIVVPARLMPVFKPAPALRSIVSEE
ncbi:MAG: HU family DNA-binding protein [Candidatus Eisenbacteria bacterium]